MIASLDRPAFRSAPSGPAARNEPPRTLIDPGIKPRGQVAGFQAPEADLDPKVQLASCHPDSGPRMCRRTARFAFS